ncbi:TAP-like protein-domain-containing protein [Mycena leptocephala]|nr:TAP-like protein-domain-containing protein [Mycena leptocephala]
MIPPLGFISLTQDLAALANGNATVLYAQIPEPPFECRTSPPPLHLNNFEVYMAIACGDPIPVNDTVAQPEEYWLNAARVSEFSDVVSSSRVLCAGYKYTVKAGSTVCPVGAKNTSFPLLLVGNTLDPATARAGAFTTFKAFPGSVVLTQDSIGHTSIVSPSLCTYRHFRTYFVNSTLPAPGTVCPVDAELFPPLVAPFTTFSKAFMAFVTANLPLIGYLLPMPMTPMDESAYVLSPIILRPLVQPSARPFMAFMATNLPLIGHPSPCP